MKELNRGKLIILLAILSHIAGMSEVSQQVTRNCQLLTLCLLGLALYVMRKKKRKAKKRTSVAPPKEVVEFAEHASKE